MGMKNKVFGFVAAAALTLSMVGGVAADTQTGDAVLDGGTCKVNVASGALDFGTWTWDGTQYVSDGNQASNLKVSVTTAWSPVNSARPTCDVSMSTNGLLYRFGARNPAITDLSARNQDVQSTWQSVGNAENPAVFALGNGTPTLRVRLNTVGAQFQPGEYSGVFDVTIHDGQ